MMRGMGSLAALLLLFSVAVPKEYAPYWYELPERHRLLARGVYVDRTSSGQARPSTMTIHLPPYRGERQARITLTHELCHLIGYAHPAMARAWRARFWPNGHPVGLPPTAYARTEPDEDFAQSCEKARDGDGPDDPDRAAFFREWGVWP